MCGRCLEGVWKAYKRYLVGVWKMSGRYPEEGVSKVLREVSQRHLNGILKASKSLV